MISAALALFFVVLMFLYSVPLTLIGLAVVAALVFAGPHRVDRLVVGGEDVVRGGVLVRADEREIARAHRVQARRFAQ